MNILFCDPLQVKSLRSSSVHIYEVLSNLSRLGHNVVPISNPGNGEEINAESRPSLWERIKRSLRSSPVYEPLKGEIRILWSFLGEIRILLSAFILIVKRKRGFDVIYRRHSLFNSAYFLAKLFRIPSIKEVNGIIADEARITKWGDNISLQIIDRIERFNMPRADKIIVVASSMKEILHSHYKIPKSKIVVIPNGANTELFKPIKKDVKGELGLDSTYCYIGFVGSFAVWHGLDDLVKSAPLILEQVTKVKFLLIGDGPLKSEINKMVDTLGLRDNFIFIGRAPYEEVPIYMNAFDVCVILKKKDIPGSPLKLGEYMACGKPVIATNTQDFRVLEEYNAGILVDPEKPEEVADAIITLLKNKKLREEMGKNGWRYVVENRSWESVAREVEKVMEEAIK